MGSRIIYDYASELKTNLLYLGKYKYMFSMLMVKDGIHIWSNYPHICKNIIYTLPLLTQVQQHVYEVFAKIYVFN